MVVTGSTPVARPAGAAATPPAGRAVAVTIAWAAEPQGHDYPAAASYLSLVLGRKAVTRAVRRLRRAETVTFRPKDLLRASGLPLLPADDPHVAADLHKIARGEALSPCLLVRGAVGRGLPLQIADGYHRVCAAYLTDENGDVPARIVPAP